VQLVKRKRVSQTTKRKRLLALKESIEKCEKNLTRRREGKKQLQSLSIREEKRREHGTRVENGVRQGSERAGISVLEGEVDACRYCILAHISLQDGCHASPRPNDAANPGCVGDPRVWI
jgi:hypothetical protein